MTPIKGKDAFLWVFKDGSWVVTVCAKTTSLEFDVEDIETTTVDSGTDRDYIPGYSDGTVGFEGLNTIDETTKYQFHEFISNRRVIHRCKMVLTDSAGRIVQYEFLAKVQRISLTNDAKTFSSNSLTLKLCGAVTETLVVTPSSSSGGSAGRIVEDHWTTTPGATSLTGASVKYGYEPNDIYELLDVERDGVGAFIITSGTPANNECKLDVSGNKVDFNTNTPFNPGEKVKMIFYLSV